MRYNVVVVGGGPAGLGAAVEAKRNGAKDVLIIERDRELGGILNQCIHNGFGLHEFKEELTGPEYAHKFIEMVKEERIDYMLDTMVLNISEDKTIEALGEEGIINIQADAIVLAMGCRERTRGAIDIPGYRPAGVYNAGAAQRLSNMEGYMVGKEIVIYGSGDIGLIMARRMTLEGAKVKAVVEINPHSSGLTRNIVQCLDDFNIPLMLSTGITHIDGKERVKGVTLCKLDEKRNLIKGTEEYISCDTVLLSVGLIPENELSVEAGVNLDTKTSGPIVNNSMATNVDGVFACGNVVHVHDLVDFVTKESKIAGKNAALYSLNKLNKGNEVKTSAGEGIIYVVPQSVNVDGDEDVNLFMRVRQIYKNKKLVVKSDYKVILEKKRLHMIPSEMENIKISKDLFKDIKGNITVSVEEA
ncbi:pyridine nucleotide-disulfide oxidoreductase [[Clostridium] sordellii]|uniref:Pyridine nucleotide-disulphide oxidoreductase n=1 Tax=Paraclostridium sordellii TaxID=1505 RepID=A0ABM9RLY1_PARSO|nr:FAD-dependent oxidoreductase [Paeniclostridium sordellii]CEJ73030.1 putative pyridine nucleotide-disulphide oxidoreductase [[Clostridium] sordellii] [Paeniclostridium sordellii]CEN68583.1 pyridine nucleotide-disulfide oxidoreductase [[Clostridium] sordellii] [Paeniclostridium sordellii]CEN71850.1 pyridine nucleotide-disulfide oxidoreductase [[Clostridium] sordellii] [Paeniclostridium sordellii]CEO22509.1 pyridine nucleotide-disulfide oxidoreductase [[Clostridium] sordellii] [Paeniclostridium